MTIILTIVPFLIAAAASLYWIRALTALLLIGAGVLNIGFPLYR